MAELMKGCNKHSRIWIKASIIEPVISMVILVMSIAMAFTILIKMNHVPSLQALNKANEIISNEINKIWHEKDLLNRKEEFGGLVLEKIVETTENNTIKIELIIRDKRGKNIANKLMVHSERQLLGFPKGEQTN